MRTTLLVGFALASLSGCGTSTSVSGLESRVSALESANTDLQDRVTALETENSDLQAQLADAVTSGDLATTLRDYVTYDNLASTLTRYPLTISSPFIEVDPNGQVVEGQSYHDLTAALEYLQGRVITEPVFIYMAPGTYSYDSALIFDYAEGDLIHVMKDPNLSGTVTLDYTGSLAAVEVETALGGFDDITLSGPGNDQSVIGIDAAPQSTFSANELYVKDFGKGFYAEPGARVHLSNTTSDSNGTGFFALGGALVDASGSTSQSDTTGYMAENGGIILADGATATGDDTAFDAELGGYISAREATAKSNTLAVTAHAASVVYAAYLKVQSNTHDLDASVGSFIDASMAGQINDTGFTGDPPTLTGTVSFSGDAAAGTVIYDGP